MRLNLKELFGVSFADRSEIRDAIAQALMDKIIKRTEGAKDINDSPFRGYSKEYKKSLDFKAAGKSSKVNLKLSGDMLGLLDIVETSGNTVTLGWTESDEAAKAHGHITGDKKGPKVKRDFFGLSPKDVKQVTDEFQDDIKDLIKAQRSESEDKFTETIGNFLKKAIDG